MNEFKETISTLTEEETIMANKIYELSEKLEAALLQDEPDTTDSNVQADKIREIDSCIEKTLAETVRKELIAVGKIENILAQYKGFPSDIKTDERRSFGTEV